MTPSSPARAEPSRPHGPPPKTPTRPERAVGVAAGRPGRRLPWVVAACSILATGCATGFIPASEAVNVIVENRSERNVTVRAIHHVDMVDFEEEIPRGEQRSFRVSHRAFGAGPVAFEIVTGPGRLGWRYRGDGRLRVPAGSVVAVVVDEEPRHSTVTVLNEGRGGRVSLERW